MATYTTHHCPYCKEQIMPSPVFYPWAETQTCPKCKRNFTCSQLGFASAWGCTTAFYAWLVTALIIAIKCILGGTPVGEALLFGFLGGFIGVIAGYGVGWVAGGIIATVRRFP